MSPMPSPGPKLRLESDHLLLSVAQDSELLSGTHRIYFVNVLGFDPISDPLGYRMGEVPSAKTLIELIEYLDEQGARPTIDQKLEEIIKKFRGSTADLIAARHAGQTIKSSPPAFIEVP